MSRTMAWMLLAAWPLTGLAVAWVMRRRGHDLLAWSVLGVAFGPLSAPLALMHARGEGDARGWTVRAGHAGEGPVDVLIGLDGSPQSEDAARMALSLLGPRAGRVVMARVLDYDTGSPAASAVTQDERDVLELAFTEEVDRVGGEQAEAVVLVGKPSEALSSLAVRDRFDLVVVAPRGRSASRALLGSTASGLLRTCPVPVLVTGRARAAATAPAPARTVVLPAS